jgi:1-aminocyclopropane-1-carboxylate deaminase
MIAGFKLLEHTHPDPQGRKRRIIGVDASAKPDETLAQVLRIARQTAAKIGLSEDSITEKDVELDTRYHAGTYGLADEATLEAIRFGARVEAFITDPVYEGKSLAAMMGMVKAGEIKDGSNVLYAHLGGQLALNAYSEIK